MYSSVVSTVNCFRFTLPFAEVISPVQYPVGGSVGMGIRAEWHRYKCLWIELSVGLSAIWHWGMAVYYFSLGSWNWKCSYPKGLHSILPYFSILTFLFFCPVIVIVVSQSCVKWRLMLNFVLQQSIKDWSLTARREWRDQWRNDLRTFSTVSMVSFVQPNADLCSVLWPAFNIHKISIKLCFKQFMPMMTNSLE